jgi:hypothetical protein
MTNTTYQIQINDGITAHFPAWQYVVRDGEDMDNDMHLHARIRSGDYFLTLATELDRIAQSLAGVKAPEAPELERIVSELMAIGQDYTISKK